MTSVGGDPDGEPVVNWQCDGSGELDVDSQVGERGRAVTLPDDPEIAEGETIIAAEVFYAYSPLFGMARPSG